ncbi:hypothetical protein ACB092_11G245000 [Castanea dentata]
MEEVSHARSGEESKPRVASQFQLASMPWLEVGFKFRGDSSGNSRGGDCRNSCKSDASNGVVQQQITKGMEVDNPFDSRESEEWRTAMDRPGVGRDEESMVAVLGGCAVDGGGAANGQEYHEANSSLSTKYDVQAAFTVSGDGDGGASAQCNVDSRGRTVTGYVEAERMEFEGRGEVDASC